MGIRCWCPNGHKLNIKAFQAGKRGICPYCGARFTIPLESTRKPGMGDRIPEPREHSVYEGPVASPPVGTPGASSSLPSAEPTPFLSAPTPLGPLPTAATPSWNVPAAGTGAALAASEAQFPPMGHAGTTLLGDSLPVSPGSPPDRQQPTAPLPEFSGAVDPLVEAPNAVWYVRPPTGGQFGPAPADVMRDWIAEGRVSPDSLVWREGWRDWQEAGQVFPQLKEPALFSTVASSAGFRPRKKTSQTQSLWLLLLLVVLVAILIGVFIYVAFGISPTPAHSSSMPPTSAASLPNASAK